MNGNGERPGVDPNSAEASQTSGLRRLSVGDTLPAEIATALAMGIRNRRQEQARRALEGEGNTSMGGLGGVQEIPRPNRFHGENPITIFDGFSTGMPGANGDTE